MNTYAHKLAPDKPPQEGRPPDGVGWPASNQIHRQKPKQIQITYQGTTIMKKERAKYKQQDDRLLKRLSQGERRRQERLRKQIAKDLTFLVV